MLFVFQVDTGMMRTFPMNLAMDTVRNLQLHIFNQSGIPVENQVLLISGGEPIEPDARVCSYATGTDTNPMFLFSKDIIKAESPPRVGEEVISSDIDFAKKVKLYKTLASTLDTVKKRASLAQQFYDVDQRILKQCEDLVHDQHLQQLGWSTVVANLDDLRAALSKRWELYQGEYTEYLANRDSYIEFLAHFKDDLQVLQRIPVLPALIELQKLVPDGDDNVFEDFKDNVTLYDWIAKTDGVYDKLYEACNLGLSQLDEDGYNQLSHQINASLRLMKDEQLTEVRGLSSRLEQLEKLKVDARNFAKEQKEITESLMKNESRADSAKDASVLPDLCKSQPHQLDMLLQNHERMVDLAGRCIDSKNEVCRVLCKRLAHIMRVECAFVEIDNKLVFGFKNLHVLRNNLKALQQVRDAPTAYFKAVVEVVRRLSFSKSFLTWAKNVSSGMQTIYNEECSKRLEFQAQYGGHFLDRLFPGMKDLPPEFATREPPAFDTFLPNLSEADVVRLRDMLPEYSELLETPDTTAIENFFRLRSSAQFTNKEVGETPQEELDEESKATEETLVVIAEGESGEPASKVSRASDSSTTPHALPHLKDLDRGCESETDTEEFEKVGHQSPYDLNFDRPSTSGLDRSTSAAPTSTQEQSSRPVITTQDVATLTEDNLGITKSEYERVKSCLSNVVDLSRQTFDQLRLELCQIKRKMGSDRVTFHLCLRELQESCTRFIQQREQEIVQRLTVDHELEISDFRKINLAKNEQIKTLLSEKCASEGEYNRLCQTVLELEEKNRETIVQWNEMKKAFEEKLRRVEVEKEQAIKEITDRLKAEHRSDIENIRARFKLMTMERSPSESSLEKIERGELSSMGHTEALLLQLTENFESEKEVAVSDAVAKETAKWQSVLDETKREMQEKFEREREQLMQDLGRKVNEHKDKEMDELRDQIRDLSYRLIVHKTDIKKASDSYKIELTQRILSLENDKAELEALLQKYQSERSGEMSTSVSVYEGKVDASTSPLRTKRRSESASSGAPGAPSPSSSSRPGKLNVESCRAGDFVLVMWNLDTKNYQILQDSVYRYFLHSDCYQELGLEIVDGQPNKQHCFAEVVSKEFCHARKSVNRFNVQKGARFFRVRVKVPGVSKVVVPPGSAPALAAISTASRCAREGLATLMGTRVDDFTSSNAFSVSPSVFSSIEDTTFNTRPSASSSPSLSPFSDKKSKLTSSQPEDQQQEEEQQQSQGNECSELISWDDPEPASGSFHTGFYDVPSPVLASTSTSELTASGEEKKCQEGGDSVTLTEQQQRQSIETSSSSTLTRRITEEQDQEVPSSGGDTVEAVSRSTCTTTVVVPENVVERATEIQEDFEVYESERIVMCVCL